MTAESKMVVMHVDELQVWKQDIINTIKEEIGKVQVRRGPIGFKDAATYLGLEQSGLRKRIVNKTFPAELIHKRGGKLYFYEDELDNYIKNGKGK